MKYIITITAALLIVLVSFSSCSSDGALDNSESFFTAEVDGTDYIIQGDLMAYGTNFTESTNIYGLKSIDALSSMYVQLPLNVQTGSYNFNDQVFGYIVEGEKAWSSLVGDGEGSVVVTEFDGVTIKGEFNFTAFDFDDATLSKEVSNGKFQVKIR